MADHCFNKYIKVTFFRGAALDLVPPVTSKQAEVRYFHIQEGDDFEAPMENWIKQAAALPGEKL